MIVRVSPSHVSGSVEAKASKSSMQRAVVAALMAKGETTLLNASLSDDSLSALRMAECLGARISKDDKTIKIHGGIKKGCSKLDCGESGLGVRMFSAISALCKQEIELSGSGSIMNRPMSMIGDTLTQLGARVESSNGFLPVKIKGPISGGVITVDGSLSSQLITGLLFALPVVDKDSIIKIKSLKSKPYIDLSLSVLSSFGIEIENRDYKEIYIKGKQEYRPLEYRVEEDWSGISFISVLGAISGEVTIRNLSHNSVQADRAIVDVLGLVGADLQMSENKLMVKPGKLKSFSYDISDCPDLAPPLTALASFCEGKSIIRGTRRLESKESNRSLTLQKEFSKMGVDISIREDSLEISGRGSLSAADVCSHGDHRIAMALAVAATRAEGPVVIRDAESVNKSYPDFFNDISKLGVKVEVINI